MMTFCLVLSIIVAVVATSFAWMAFLKVEGWEATALAYRKDWQRAVARSEKAERSMLVERSYADLGRHCDDKLAALEATIKNQQATMEVLYKENEDYANQASGADEFMAAKIQELQAKLSDCHQSMADDYQETQRAKQQLEDLKAKQGKLVAAIFNIANLKNQLLARLKHISEVSTFLPPEQPPATSPEPTNGQEVETCPAEQAEEPACQQVEG